MSVASITPHRKKLEKLVMVGEIDWLKYLKDRKSFSHRCLPMLKCLVTMNH